MEFMIWPLTRAGSTSGSTTTRRPSRFRRSADGGETSAVVAIRSRAAWSSLPMAADRTARACDCGNLNCSALFAPLAAGVLEIADQLLLLGIDGYSRLVLGHGCLDRV